MPKIKENFQLFFTEKHVSHDKVWILQSSCSNSICFACAVETLEDSTSLNVRKRKMVSDIMDLLMKNRTIWEIFTRQKATLCHTGNILLKLLSSKDKQLSTLVVETLGILVQRSKEENATSLLESLVIALRETEDIDINNLESLTPYFCFLGKILRRTGSMVKTLLIDHNWLFEFIVEGTEQIPEGQALSFWYILAQIYQSEHSRHINIRNSKLVIETVVRTLGNCVSKDLQLNVLSVLMSFARNRLLCELIIEDDNEISLSKSSFATMMKKLLLSTNADIQRISVQCLTEVVKTSSACENEKIIHFAQMLMSKGLCEFLFELLSSPGRLLAASILSCLQHFATFTVFFSAGHVIYGIEPILESLKNAIKINDRLLINPALQLLLQILQNSKSYSAVEKHTNCILEMMIKLSEVQDIKILDLAISCATETVGNDNGNHVDLKIIKSAMEQFGNKLLKISSSAIGKNPTDPGISNLLKNTLNFVRCNTRFLMHEESDATQKPVNETNTSEALSSRVHKLYIEELQHAADVHLIPSTIMLLPIVGDPEVFKSFFDILFIILSKDNGNAFATKLCESSFVRIALEVKAGLLKEDPTTESGAFIDKFLVLLACKLDDTYDQIGLKATLTETLPLLRTVPGEWHLFFHNVSSNLDMELVYPIRVACFSLLYISARFGDPLWKMDVILRCISQCMMDEKYLQNLTNALKRQVIFLWAYARNHSSIVTNEILLTEQSIISCIEKEYKSSSLFILVQCFIHWVIDSVANTETKVWALSELLAQDNGIEYEESYICDITKGLISYRNSQEFYTICMQIIAFETYAVARRALGVVSFVIRDGDDVESYLQIKMIMNKIILSHESQLNHFNILVLLELYRYLLLSPTSTISDVDLKLASRLCNLFLEYQAADVQVAILNSLNQFLFHINNRGDSSKVAVLCNEIFLKEVYTFIPHQKEYTGLQREKSASASLVFVSQLIATVSSQGFPTVSIKPVIVEKEVLILSLGYSESPLIQLACLQFWNCFLTLGSTHAYIFQSEEEHLNLCENDLKTILIYIQNLLLNEEQIIRDSSAKGMLKIMQCLRNRSKDFQSPWNAFIFVHMTETLSPGSDLEFKLSIILFLLCDGSSVTYMKTVLPSIMKLITDGFHDINMDVIKLLLQLISILAKNDKLSVHQLADISKFLHSIEDNARGLLTEQRKTEKMTKPLFAVYRDVVFPVYNSDQTNMVDYLEIITECKNIVAKRQKSMHSLVEQIL